MPLIARADLEQQFGKSEIDQLVGTDAQADARLTDAIERTETEIESRLGERFVLPVQPTVEIKEIAGTLVRARLYVHNPPEWITEAAAEKRRYLDEAARGKRGIQGLETKGSERKSVTRTTKTREDRTFTEESLQGFMHHGGRAHGRHR